MYVLFSVSFQAVPVLDILVVSSHQVDLVSLVFKTEHHIAQNAVSVGHEQRHDASAEVGDSGPEAAGVFQCEKVDGAAVELVRV